MSEEPLTDPRLLAEWFDNLEPTRVPYRVNGNWDDPESAVTTDEFNITLHKSEIAVIVDALQQNGRYHG